MHILQTSQPLDAGALVAAAGIIVAVALAYFPKLNTLYAGLARETKGLIALGLMALVAGAVAAQSCGGVHILPWSISCDQSGFEALIRNFGIAIGANQGTFLALPEAPAVTVAKAFRA